MPGSQLFGSRQAETDAMVASQPPTAQEAQMPSVYRQASATTPRDKGPARYASWNTPARPSGASSACSFG